MFKDLRKAKDLTQAQLAQTLGSVYMREARGDARSMGGARLR